VGGPFGAGAVEVLTADHRVRSARSAGLLSRGSCGSSWWRTSPSHSLVSVAMTLAAAGCSRPFAASAACSMRCASMSANARCQRPGRARGRRCPVRWPRARGAPGTAPRSARSTRHRPGPRGWLGPRQTTGPVPLDSWHSFLRCWDLNAVNSKC
jgi:hypothetical protein